MFDALARPSPAAAQRPRIIEIRDNLIDRIAEADREGWLGEVEGLNITLAGANDKLAQRLSGSGPTWPPTRPGTASGTEAARGAGLGGLL
jgi:hypothetical protein